MASLIDYFDQNRYKAKYEFGTRVFGKWNKIPFIGTVGQDSVISEIEGPRLLIHVDLPIMYEKKLHNIIIVKHKDVKLLKDYDTEEKDDRNTSSKTGSKKPVLDSDKRKRKSR